MKILVAGGSGFIGSYMCERLLKEGHFVLCVDNFLTSTKKNIENLTKHGKFTLIEADITKPLVIKEKIDGVFHLASPASPNHHSPISYHSLPMETMMANTTGTLQLLILAKKNNARFLFASSSEVYGDPLEHPQKESYRGNVSTTGPRSVYDEAKRFGETLTAYFQRNENVDTRIARIFNTYGPRMMKQDMRMLGRFIEQAIENKPITVFGDGKQTRSLCYIDDMVEALMRLMFYEDTRGTIVNLGSTDEHTVYEYAEMVKQSTNSSSQIVLKEQLPEDDPLKRKPDISLAKKVLNWSAKVSIETGITQVVNWYKNNI